MEVKGNILPVLKMGNPALRQVAKEVEDIHSEEVQQAIADILATADSIKVTGLAAPQISIPLRIFLYNVPANPSNILYTYTPEYDPDGVPITMVINPKITPIGDRKDKGYEACLSLPGMASLVSRFHSIEYSFYTPIGEFVEGEAHGFHARALQHENDHLDGILQIDHLEDPTDIGYIDEILKEKGSAEAAEKYIKN